MNLTIFFYWEKWFIKCHTRYYFWIENKCFFFF